MSPSFLDGGTLALLIVAFQSLFFKEMGQPRPLFVYFHSFQTIYRIKTVYFSGIRTRKRRRSRWPLDHHHCLFNLSFDSNFAWTTLYVFLCLFLFVLLRVNFLSVCPSSLCFSLCLCVVLSRQWPQQFILHDHVWMWMEMAVKIKNVRAAFT